MSNGKRIHACYIQVRLDTKEISSLNMKNDIEIIIILQQNEDNLIPSKYKLYNINVFL